MLDEAQYKLYDEIVGKFVQNIIGLTVKKKGVCLTNFKHNSNGKFMLNMANNAALLSGKDAVGLQLSWFKFFLIKINHPEMTLKRISKKEIKDYYLLNGEDMITFMRKELNLPNSIFEEINKEYY